MRLQLGMRTATVLGLALLWAAPAAADHKDRKKDHDRDRARHVQAHQHHGDHDRYEGRDRHDRHVTWGGEYWRYQPVSFTHYVRGHPVRVVMHQPYYCAACQHHFRHENAFHKHLHRKHRVARRFLWRHLVRVGWGWAYFG